jgi:NADH dehydrogenase [ubiquinone] 1 alpha subcomplex assembly factor 7
MQLGLPLRFLGPLKEAKTDERRQEIRSAAARLVYLTGMGKECQVMGITNKSSEIFTPASAWPFLGTDLRKKK